MSEKLAADLVSNKLFFRFLLGAAWLPGMAFVFTLITAMQYRYMPIVDNFEILELVIDIDGDVVISGSFHKNFPDWLCEYKSMQWFMPSEGPEGRPIDLRIDASYKDARKDEKQNNRQKGYNYFFGWKIEVSEYPELDTFTGFVNHRCMWFFPARTYFPLIEIERNLL